jgi:hypothetical protein
MYDIISSFQNLNVHDNDLIAYIQKLQIENVIKVRLIHLIENDNHSNYLDIYNICLENNIELPPI